MNPSSLPRTRLLVSLALFTPSFAISPLVSAADDPDPVPVSLAFTAEIGGQPFACGQDYAGVGRTAGKIAVTDFRLFVSELALLDADGQRVPLTLDDDGRWQDGRVALLDFENGSDRCDNGTSPTNDTVTGSVPVGEYRGLELTIGVPFDSNHGDPTLAGSPLNLTSMFWNWRGGYRFLKVDTMPVSQRESVPAASSGGHGGDQGGGHGGGHGPVGAWMLHLGSTGCESATRTSAPPEPCANPNRVVVSFEDFDAERDRIVIDPAALLVDSDLASNAPDTSPGCMSFPGDADCAGVMPRAGLSYGGVQGGEQQLVTLRRDAP